MPYAYVRLCTDIECEYTTASDTGEYTFSRLGPGSWKVDVYDHHRRGWESGGTIVVENAALVQDIVLPDAYAGGISATVRDESGHLLTDRSATVCRDDHSMCDGMWINGEGRFAIEFLAPGDYYVTVYAGRHHPDVFGPLTVGGATLTVDLQLTPAPTGAIAGDVVNAEGEATWASVQACRGGHCYWASMNSIGHYEVAGLPAGEYVVMAQPWDAFRYSGTSVTVSVGTTSTQAQTLVLENVAPPPADTSLASTSGQAASTVNGLPMLRPEATVLRTEGCVGGAATFTLRGGGTLGGTLTEGPDGVYQATFTPTFGGVAEIDIVLTCPGGTVEETSFNVYIDPSGYVRNTLGDPIVGATVILLRSDSPDGPFTAPESGSLIMSPSNRTNPDTTDSTGHFGWDVVEGYYKVRTSMAGCVAADTGAPYAETIVYKVPPPVFDIDLRLWCGEERPTDTTHPTLTCTPATFELRQTGAAVEARVSDTGSGPVDALVSTAADTSSVGVKSVTLTGRDQAGNVATETCEYEVVYDFSGFASPIDTDVVNSAKAGQSIPVKWRLVDAAGAPVTNLSTATVSVVAGTFAATGGTDAIEQYVTGASGLQNLGNGYYQINWKTQTSYAKSSKTLRLDLGEGAAGDPLYHTADFKFVK